MVHDFNHLLRADQRAQGFVEFGSQFPLLFLVPTEIRQFLKQRVQGLRFDAVRAGGCDSNRFIDRKRVFVQPKPLAFSVCFRCLAGELLEFEQGLLCRELAVFVGFRQFLGPVAD